MRIYKSSYTVPLPPGAKIITRKGVRFAKLKSGEARLTKDGSKVLLETAHWHISFEDNLNIRRRLKAFTNRAATQRAADRIQDLLSCTANGRQPDKELSRWLEGITPKMRGELVRFGILNGDRAAAGKTLSDYIEQFREYLTKKEREPKHIKATVSSIKRLSEACGFRYWSDVSAERVKAYLDEKRDGGKGISKRTYNGYLKAAKFFCKWLAKELHTISPLTHIEGLENEATDRRHERRALTDDELRRLLEATGTAPERFGLTGQQRRLLYKMAVQSGLRANELRTLRKSAFDFDALTITVETCYSKHRKKDVLPLRANLAAELQDYLANKLPGAKVFYVTDKAGNMLKADLADTQIPYRDESGRVCDFHALRHAFITSLRNAPSRVAQALARHRSSAMTDKYTHIRLQDERAALESLPDLSLPSSVAQPALKTGTDDAPEILSKSCFSFAQTRTPVDNSGQKNIDNFQKTPLGTNNKGRERTLNQPVAGSNPASPITKGRKKQIERQRL